VKEVADVLPQLKPIHDAILATKDTKVICPAFTRAMPKL